MRTGRTRAAASALRGIFGGAQVFEPGTNDRSGAAMLKRMIALAFLVLAAADLAGCGSIQPCNDLPRASTGACSIGRSPSGPG